MLADEDVAGRRPDRPGELPRQLARGGDGFGVATGVLQRVGEEEERLVEPGRGRILLDQLAVAPDRFRARVGRPALVACRRGLVARVGFGLCADEEREPARAQEAGQPRQHLGLLGRRAAQLEHPPQRLFLLVFLGDDDLFDAAVEQRWIASRSSRCGCCKQKGDHGVATLSGAGCGCDAVCGGVRGFRQRWPSWYR